MKKILAADDDPGMRALYFTLFSDEGYEVQTAADADAAMETYMTFKPDLLVLDVDMPGGGGQRVFSVLRRILQLGVPVVFVTGFPANVIDNALFHDKVVVLQKPAPQATLLGEISRLLGEEKK
jgi:CheY-like chemotaxis protein